MILDELAHSLVNPRTPLLLKEKMSEVAYPFKLHCGIILVSRETAGASYSILRSAWLSDYHRLEITIINLDFTAINHFLASLSSSDWDCVRKYDNLSRWRLLDSCKLQVKLLHTGDFEHSLSKKIDSLNRWEHTIIERHINPAYTAECFDMEHWQKLMEVLDSDKLTCPSYDANGNEVSDEECKLCEERNRRNVRGWLRTAFETKQQATVDSWAEVEEPMFEFE